MLFRKVGRCKKEKQSNCDNDKKIREKQSTSEMLLESFCVKEKNERKAL